MHDIRPHIYIYYVPLGGETERFQYESHRDHWGLVVIHSSMRPQTNIVPREPEVFIVSSLFGNEKVFVKGFQFDKRSEICVYVYLCVDVDIGISRNLPKIHTIASNTTFSQLGNAPLPPEGNGTDSDRRQYYIIYTHTHTYIQYY